MVGQRQSPTTSDASFLRKIRKPLIERKRRERMNNSLAQLKSLLAATIRQHTSPNAKLDKSDILELTVRHLTQLQQQQTAVTMATEAASYSSGFKDCAKETIGYVTSARLMNDTSVCNLSNHLHNSLITRTGNPTVDRLNAYQASESQMVQARDLCFNDGRTEMLSYNSSTHYRFYGNINNYYVNVDCSDSENIAADRCGHKPLYNVNHSSPKVAPLVEDDDKVWRPW